MQASESRAAAVIDHCRLCGAPMGPVVLSLGAQPISNRLARSETDARQAPRYPLEVALCRGCGLVQLAQHLEAEQHFHGDYAYMSSASSTWIDHCARYAAFLATHCNIAPGELIVEVGSNDGALLKEIQRLGHRVLGVEPSQNVAEIAKRAGAPTMTAFFNAESAKAIEAEHGKAKCIVGNNVLAHVPDTNGFLLAARDLLAEDGVLCFEFPHYVHILEKSYFDTIYHEHYAYLGVGPLDKWARANGMAIVHVEEQPTHGGSLRVLLKRAGQGDADDAVASIIERERALGGEEAWRAFGERLVGWRAKIRSVIGAHRAAGRRVAGYAAASKATVMLNYAGLSREDIDYCCDASPLKQNRFIPGAAIEIRAPEALKSAPPEVVVIFAWNIFDELSDNISKLIDAPIELIHPFPDVSSSRLEPMAKPR